MPLVSCAPARSPRGLGSSFASTNAGRSRRDGSSAPADSPTDQWVMGSLLHVHALDEGPSSASGCGRISSGRGDSNADWPPPAAARHGREDVHVGSTCPSRPRSFRTGSDRGQDGEVRRLGWRFDAHAPRPARADAGFTHTPGPAFCRPRSGARRGAARLRWRCRRDRPRQPGRSSKRSKPCFFHPSVSSQTVEFGRRPVEPQQLALPRLVRRAPAAPTIEPRRARRRIDRVLAESLLGVVVLAIHQYVTERVPHSRGVFR